MHLSCLAMYKVFTYTCTWQFPHISSTVLERLVNVSKTTQQFIKVLCQAFCHILSQSNKIPFGEELVSQYLAYSRSLYLPQKASGWFLNNMSLYQISVKHFAVLIKVSNVSFKEKIYLFKRWLIKTMIFNQVGLSLAQNIPLFVIEKIECYARHKPCITCQSFTGIYFWRTSIELVSCFFPILDILVCSFKWIYRINNYPNNW